MKEVFGERRIAVARELTKLHEEVVRKNTAELVKWLAGRELPGEIVLVVEGNTKKTIGLLCRSKSMFVSNGDSRRF